VINIKFNFSSFLEKGLSKKAQLGLIEMKFFLMGLVFGIIVGAILVTLSCKGVGIPKIAFFCK